MTDKGKSKSMMSSVMSWVDRRFPVTENLERHLTKHPVPKKVNFYYLFGALLMVVFMIQVITGIWLMMFYTNTEAVSYKHLRAHETREDLGMRGVGVKKI